MKISAVRIARLCTAIMVICLVIGESLSAQERPRDAASLSFVFLPLRSSELHASAAEQFMDEFLKDIRMQGHNAVSTRYLRSILLDSRFGALEDCTTSVCMKNLCRVVGTRFLVHGSLDADSSSGLLIELRVVDAPSGFEITSQIESFKKNPSLLGAQVLDFTEKILQKVTAALSTGKVIQEPLQFMQSDTLITAQPVKKKPEQMINSIVPNDTQSVSRTGKLEIDTAGNGRNELAADNQQSQAIKQSQSNSFDDSTTVNNVVRNVNPIPDTLVNPGNNNVVIAKSISDGTDTVNNTVLLNDTQTSIVGLISTNSTEEHIDTNETESNPTIVAQVLKPDDGTSITSTKSSVSEQTTIIAQTVGPVAPSEALNSKPKGNSFKKLRIASFGIITMAGCIGGIITNGVIKKSLDEESALYKVYMKANAEQTEETYQRYVSQTDKTDAKIRQRSLLYALGVLGLTACTVSIRF